MLLHTKSTAFTPQTQCFSKQDTTKKIFIKHLIRNEGLNSLLKRTRLSFFISPSISNGLTNTYYPSPFSIKMFPPL